MTAFALPVRPLMRRRNAVVAGVAGGLADHLGWRTGATRALFIVLTAVWGAGALFYVWLWAFAPLAEGEQRITRRAPVTWITLGTSIVLTLLLLTWIAGIGHRGDLFPALLPTLFLAMCAAVTGGLWSALFDRHDPSRGGRHDIVARGTATVLLAVHTGCSLITGSHDAVAFLSLLFALFALIGIAAVWSPALFARLRELQAARVRTIRDEQRSEMAAHLHDSVLQTLALIQNRAGGSSEAGRLARAQERELRAWLYDGDVPAENDLATDLRDYASALELDYEATVTVVSAGVSAERASGEVAAAAREAMLNAARHAGGDVSVYIEGSPAAVEVHVRDRGPGFDAAAVPVDRLGVRESIIGRMRRAGGSADVVPGAGGVGTRVYIRYPAEANGG